MNFFEYWFLFPTTLLITTVAMAVGFEVLACVAPLLIAGLGLPMEVAIGTALLTAACTCGSAFMAYLPTKLIDFNLGIRFLWVMVPATLLGVGLSIGANAFLAAEHYQVVLLAGSLFAVATSFLRTLQKFDILLLNQTIDRVYGGKYAETRLTTAAGEQISYSVVQLADGLGIAAIAALFLGLVSNGLGELNSYFWMQRCRVPSQVAIPTSIFVLFVTSAIAALGYSTTLFFHTQDWLNPFIKVALFTVPSGLIGGQLGSILAEQMPLPALERITTGLLCLLGFWLLSGVLV